MNATLIRQFALALPAEAPYFQPSRRGLFDPPVTLTAQERVAKCLADPAFPWHLASALAAAGLPLPTNVTAPYMVRAYWSFGQDGCDSVVEAARVLHSPAQERDRTILQALLLAHDINDDYISRLTGIPAPVVAAYEQLFFNVRDRREDRLFITGLLYPPGRLQSLRETAPDPSLILLRAGHEHGALRVAQLAGLLPATEAVDTSHELEQGVLVQANAMLAAGVATGPVVNQALRLVAAGKNVRAAKGSGFDDGSLGLTAIAGSHNVMGAVKRYCTAGSTADPGADLEAEGELPRALRSSLVPKAKAQDAD